MLEKNAPKKKADVAPVIDWIPCSERLPNKSDFYMVCAYNGDTYISISEKFMQGNISEDEFVERYNRLIEQEAEKHWEPVEPHEHI